MDDFICSLPELFECGKGEVIYKGRNELRRFTIEGLEIVVKSYAIPNFINQIAYGFLRSSKAQRSCEYANLLRQEGIGSPAPIGYCTRRRGLLFENSYYACLASRLRYSYIDLMKGNVPHADKFFEAVGRVAGEMHNKSMIHKDFSRGNILVDNGENGEIATEIIDLNRIRFHAIDINEGCKNFERLPANEHMHRLMANGYAQVRGYDAETCFSLIRKFRLQRADAGKVMEGLD